jgi:hypothetical protein
MRVGDVPLEWATGNEFLSRENRLAIALLRLAGCECEYPLLRNAYDEDRTPNSGPRCKMCKAQVLIDAPTEEQKKARGRAQHLANKEIMTAVPELNGNEFFSGLGDCYKGCGCT